MRSQLTPQSLNALGKSGLQQIDVGAEADELEAAREIFASERFIGGCGSEKLLMLLRGGCDALDGREVGGMLRFARDAEEVGQIEKADTDGIHARDGGDLFDVGHADLGLDLQHD